MVLLIGGPTWPDSMKPNANSWTLPIIQKMNFLQLKLILDSFSRSSFVVAISASTLQDGANESPESRVASRVGVPSLKAIQLKQPSASPSFVP